MALAQLDSYLIRGKHLLSELELFEDHLKREKKDHAVNLRAFKNDVRRDMKALERAAAVTPAVHDLPSSNMPFLEAVWDTAKSCSGIVGMQKPFKYDSRHPTTTTRPPGKESREIIPQPRRPHEGDEIQPCQGVSSNHHRRILVNIVAQGGQEWVKVSTITEKTLLYEIAKDGWDSEEDDSGELDARQDDGGGDTAVSLLQQARALRAAVAGVTIRYQRPKIRFVLPKIQLGRVQKIDNLMNTIRSTGIVVQCAVQDPKPPQPPPLADVLSSMTFDEFSTFTPTLNIDCTILLALVSDLSHSPISGGTAAGAAGTTGASQASDQLDQLLPTIIWPAMSKRELVCTAHAARRMREIVANIGTSTEAARTKLLLRAIDTDDNNALNPSHIHAAFQELSPHPIPPDWNIPIQTIPDPPSSLSSSSFGAWTTPPLSPLNRSVFLSGYLHRRTTLTANRTVVNAILHRMDLYRRQDDESQHQQEEKKKEEPMEADGLDVWICPVTRSLREK